MIVPIAPSSISLLAARTAGRKRVHIPSIAKQLRSGGRACDALGVGNGCRERLLDQHGFAVGDRLQGLIGMRGIRRRDVDRVDAGIAGHGVQIRISARGAEFRLEGFGLFQVARADAGQRGVRQEREIGGEMPCDAARPDDPPLKRFFHASLRTGTRRQC